MESNLVCNHTSDWQNRTTAKREPDLLITSMIKVVSDLFENIEMPGLVLKAKKVRVRS